MAIDTLVAYVGVYANVDDALADYDAIHALHMEAGLIDAYDAAVIERKDDGKVKIVKKHETPSTPPARVGVSCFFTIFTLPSSLRSITAAS